MRIGVNCYPLRADIGGLKQYFFTLFDELLASPAGHRYILYHFPHNAGELSKLDSGEWRRHALLLDDQPQIAQHFDDIDVYFCPFGALWPRPAPKPSVVMLADIQETRYPEFFTPDDLFQRDWHFRGSTHIADLVITISEFSKRTLVEHHRISPDKVRVIYPAADDRFHRAAQVAVRLEQPLPASFVLYPANRWRHKNHEGLLRAIGILKHQHALPIHAVLTGYDVPNGYSVAGRARELGISELVHQVGYVTVEQMAYLYTRATLLVFPSLYEGFGIPVVESMAAGCPVLCADETSLPEIAADAALYFDPASPDSIAAAIQRGWAQPALRRDLSLRGAARSRRFSGARMAEDHLSAFATAIASHSPGEAWKKQLYEGYRRRLAHTKRSLGWYARGRADVATG